MACLGAPISSLLCWLLLVLIALEIGLTAAPCEVQTPIQSSTNQTINKLGVRDINELVTPMQGIQTCFNIKDLEVTLTMQGL